MQDLILNGKGLKKDGRERVPYAIMELRQILERSLAEQYALHHSR